MLLSIDCKRKKYANKTQSQLYDIFYERADRLLKRYNPCKIQIDKSGHTSCVYYRYIHATNDKLCCNYCNNSYWNNGCTTQCLPCKLYICSCIPGKSRIIRLFYLLRKEAQIYCLPVYNFYCSKDESFRELLKHRFEHTL